MSSFAAVALLAVTIFLADLPGGCGNRGNPGPPDDGSGEASEQQGSGEQAPE